jgi:hypothetical protein
MLAIFQKRMITKILLISCDFILIFRLLIHYLNHFEKVNKERSQVNWIDYTKL